MTFVRAVAMLVAPLLLIGAGCRSLSVDSPAFRTTQVRGKRPYRFRVEKADGPLILAGARGGQVPANTGVYAPMAVTGSAEVEQTLGSAGVTVESINRALAEIRPDLHGGESSIPISIHVSGDIAPVMESTDPFGPLGTLLFYTWMEASGKVTVKIYTGDGVMGRKGRCDATYTHRMGLLPFALLAPNREERPTWRKVFGFGSAPDLGMVQSRLAATALAEAIDAMTDGEIEALARSVPKTLTETEHRRLLEARTVETVHLTQGAEENVPPVVLEHHFMEMERAAKASHPAVLKQEYSGRTRLGLVEANVAGFDKDAADEWLLRRLIPKICETKALVIDLEGLPPGDAQFSVVSDETDEHHVRSIHFRQIQ